jgi:hypothetical protein
MANIKQDNKLEKLEVPMINLEISHINGFNIFLLGKRRRSELDIYYWLTKFNINEYNIYKGTQNFRLLDLEDFLSLRYSRFYFIKKELDINTKIWIEYLKEVNIRVLYLDKIPNFNPYEKIKIIEWQTLNKTTN